MSRTDLLRCRRTDPQADPAVLARVDARSSHCRLRRLARVCTPARSTGSSVEPARSATSTTRSPPPRSHSSRPTAVREAWEHLPSGMTPSEVTETYAARCTDWGTETLAAFDPARMDRLDRLGRRIADGASPALGVLFAALAIGRPARRCRWSCHAHDAGPAGDAWRGPHRRHPSLRPHPGRGDPGVPGTGAAFRRAVGRAPRLAGSVPRPRGAAYALGSRPSG